MSRRNKKLRRLIHEIEELKAAYRRVMAATDDWDELATLDEIEALLAKEAPVVSEESIDDDVLRVYELEECFVVCFPSSCFVPSIKWLDDRLREAREALHCLEKPDFDGRGRKVRGGVLDGGSLAMQAANNLWGRPPTVMRRPMGMQARIT